MSYHNVTGTHISRISITVNSSELPSTTCLYDFALEKLNSAIDEMLYNRGGGVVNIVHLKERSYNDTIFRSIDCPRDPVNCMELTAYYSYEPEKSIILHRFDADANEFSLRNLRFHAMRKLYEYLIANNIKVSDVINIEDATENALHVTFNAYIRMEGNCYDS